MNILFACDNNYAKYLLVAMSSIIKSRDKNRESYPIDFYVLSSNISQESINYIEDFLKNRNAKIHFITVNNSDFEDFPIYIDYLSVATYSRLRTADYLPKNLDKIIYLDTDILVNDSLLPLWNTNLDDFPIAACEDPFIEQSEYKKTIGIMDSHKYFNAGVLLINLEKWRELDIFNSSLSAIKKSNLKYQDQDILNLIFQHNLLYLDAKFNFTRNHREIIKKQGNKNPVVASMPIAIYHYVGAKKAWHAKCTVSNCSQFHKIYREFINPPSSWNIEKISLLQKIKRAKKDITDKVFYKIY